MKLVLLSVTIFCSFLAFAHEGHDHDSPTKIQAPKGGIVKAVETAIIEVVAKGKDLKIYLYDLQAKPIKTDGFVVTASAQKPKIKTEEMIPLQIKDQHFEASYDAKGAHRYTLILSVKQPSESHADKLKFTIEPHE